MPNARMRRADVDDVGAIMALSRAAYAKWVPLIGREPLPMTANYNHAVAEHLVDLLEEDGRLTALVEMIARSDHLLIENLAVRPDRQGMGTGDRMLAHAESLARSMQYREVRLYTNAVFTSNIAFYAKRGYEEYQRGAIVPGAVTVFMKKVIAAR